MVSMGYGMGAIKTSVIITIALALAFIEGSVVKHGIDIGIGISVGLSRAIMHCTQKTQIKKKTERLSPILRALNSRKSVVEGRCKMESCMSSQFS